MKFAILLFMGLIWPLSATGQDMKAEEMVSELNMPFNKFLSKYVIRDGEINLVAYDEVTDADERLLERYIETLSMLDISAYSDDQAMAYWFNLYNAATLDLILDHYPVKSIKKIGFLTGPWDKNRLTVRGQEMSLNNIEHDTVREMYNEPRVHFAFNCASIGCPNLKMTAWEASTLDTDLTKAAKDYIASPRGVKIKNNGDITASSIFKWYKEDFGETDADVMSYLAKYAKGEKKTALQEADKIEDYDYDWSLNIAK